MTDTPIPFGKPMIDAAEIEAMTRVMSGPQLVHGPVTKAFEEAFAARIGAKRAVSVSSCTAGLHLSLFAQGIGAGDEVVVPAMTHVATAHAVEFCGARPVFIDVEPDTGNLDANALENAVRPKIRAIMPVHYLGLPCDMDRINGIARRAGAVVVEDCALAVDATYDGRKVGTLGSTGCFSFYPVKHMTTLEGGMVTTNDGILADAIAKHTGVSHAIMGLIFLAAITELPELVTTSAAAFRGDAALALNNMFGGITMQTAILAVADAAAVRVTLSSFPRKPTPILEGALLILLLTTTLVIISIGDLTLFSNIGLGAALLAAIYVVSITVLNHYDKDHAWRPVDLPEPEDTQPPILPWHALHDLSLRALILQSCGVAAVILVCGILLVQTSAAIAEQSGLGSSFIGVTLLAATTSLPVLSTTVAAVRMGAYTMAVSNIFGSNLIMIALILPADMAYREGPILAHVDRDAQFSLVTGILVTAIYVAGLLIRRTPPLFGAGLDSWLVLIVYVASLVALYHF